MPDISVKRDAVTPVYLKIAAYLNGLCDIQSVVRTAWPRAKGFDYWQYDIIGNVLRGLTGKIKEVAIKGCTGAGKGASVACAINLWFEASDEAKVIINSQSQKHALEVMYAEVCKWRREMSARCPDEILETKVKCHSQKHIVVTNPDNGEGFTGHHGGAVLFCFDECTQTPQEYFDLSKTQAHLIVALGNPRTRGGWFKSLFPAHDPDTTQTTLTDGGANRRLVTIAGTDCANVRTGKQVIPNQLSRAEYSEIMAHPDANHRRVYGEGRFPIEDAELQLILPSWLGLHYKATATGRPEAFGCDIADSLHGDRTILVAGNKTGILKMLQRRRADVMATVGWIITMARDRLGVDLTHGQHCICIDADGLGKGAADRLEELGCWVIKHRGSETPEDTRSYFNFRTETYGLLAVRLSPTGPFSGSPWALPNDSRLLEELCAVDKIYESDGMRFRITPKERPSGSKAIKDHRGQIIQTLRQKLGRSPDKGDATALLWRAIHTMFYAGDLDNMLVNDGEIVIPSLDDVKEIKKKEVDGFDEFFQEIMNDPEYGGAPDGDERDADSMLRRFSKLSEG